MRQQYSLPVLLDAGESAGSLAGYFLVVVPLCSPFPVSSACARTRACRRVTCVCCVSVVCVGGWGGGRCVCLCLCLCSVGRAHGTAPLPRVLYGTISRIKK